MATATDLSILPPPSVRLKFSALSQHEQQKDDFLNENRKPIIAVHGGAGRVPEERNKLFLDAVSEAADVGFQLLKNSANAVESVTEAVAFLEDSGLFNAGAGSTLNLEGNVEMEASVMDGATLTAGAVGLLRDIKNPVRLARLVMEKTDHVFIVGEGAEQLARMFNMERRTPSLAKRAQYKSQMKSLKDGKFELPRLAELVRAHPEVFQLETVGAVAMDADGNVAAATSTGGFPLKMPGRIGDSPSIGCGTYADNLSGACSATGVGEIALRLVLAKRVCYQIETGKTAQEAVEEAVKFVGRRVSGVYSEIGLLAVDANGRIGAAHSSPNLCWAIMAAGIQEPVASLTAKLVK
jgi:beta-aspartyl-peptidase (threonine type)